MKKLFLGFLLILLASCMATPQIQLKSGDMAMEIKQKAPIVRKVDISPDGRYVLSGGLDSFILWDILQGKKIQTFTHEDYMGHGIVVAFSPDGKHFGRHHSARAVWGDGGARRSGRLCRHFGSIYGRRARICRRTQYQPDGWPGLARFDRRSGGSAGNEAIRYTGLPAVRQRHGSPYRQTRGERGRQLLVLLEVSGL